MLQFAHDVWAILSKRPDKSLAFSLLCHHKVEPRGNPCPNLSGPIMKSCRTPIITHQIFESTITSTFPQSPVPGSSQRGKMNCWQYWVSSSPYKVNSDKIVFQMQTAFEKIPVCTITYPSQPMPLCLCIVSAQNPQQLFMSKQHAFANPVSRQPSHVWGLARSMWPLRQSCIFCVESKENKICTNAEFIARTQHLLHGFHQSCPIWVGTIIAMLVILQCRDFASSKHVDNAVLTVACDQRSTTSTSNIAYLWWSSLSLKVENNLTDHVCW